MSDDAIRKRAALDRVEEAILALLPDGDLTAATVGFEMERAFSTLAGEDIGWVIAHLVTMTVRLSSLAGAAYEHDFAGTPPQPINTRLVVVAVAQSLRDEFDD